MKIYSSFTEINRELEIYKLQKEIDKEKIKQNTRVIKRSLSPVNIGIEIALATVQKLLYGRVIQKFLRFR